MCLYALAFSSQQGLDRARSRAAHLAHLRTGDFHPAGGALEAQLEQLLGQLALVRVQLVIALLAQSGALRLSLPTSIS